MPIVKDFHVEQGVSIELRGAWYKFTCGITVQPEEGDNLEEIKKKAWSTVEFEIEKQVMEIIDVKK